jgi:adenylate kinase
MKVVGVFGISGVGKTTMIAEIARLESTWQRASAGSLIQQRLPGVDRDALRTLPLDEILDNQEAIVRGLSDLRSVNTAGIILFDGHLLIDSAQGLLEVPLDAIRRLKLDAMLFVCDAPEEIARRRQSDPCRARAERSKQEIVQEQSRACAIAQRYAGDLGIPFITATPSQRRYVISTIRERLSPQRTDREQRSYLKSSGARRAQTRSVGSALAYPGNAAPKRCPPITLTSLSNTLPSVRSRAGSSAHPNEFAPVHDPSSSQWIGIHTVIPWARRLSGTAL